MSKLDYLDFNLLIEGEEAKGYQARVLESPAGQAVGDFAPPFSGLELENFFLRVGRPRQGVRRLEFARDGGRQSLRGAPVFQPVHR